MKYIAVPQEQKNRNILFSFYNYDYNAPACEMIHFHRYYEFIIVERGSMTVFIDGVSYDVKPGECVVIQPFQAHSFHLNADSKNLTYNFLKNYASSFDTFSSQKRITNPIFSISPVTSDFIVSKTKELFGKKMVFRSPPEKKYETDIKSITYSLCSEFLKSAEYSPINNRSQNIIMDVIEYICDNFEQNISLKEFAQKHDYNYQYLSRRFNNFFDTGFKEVLNRYRIEQAISLLEETNQPISSIAFTSGFQSIRSFNDACLKYYNKTPSQIRSKHN